MGAWGTGPFENDEAREWLGDLAKAETLDFVRRALEPVTGGSREYPKTFDSRVALAAAEIVGALKGKPGMDLPREARAWTEARRDGLTPELVADAKKAVAAILANSELRHFWEEEEQLPAWKDKGVNLQDRLAAGARPAW